MGLVLLFVVSLPAVTSRLYAADEIEYFAFLRSLWFDGDLSFENEYRYFYDRGIARAHGFHRTFLELQSATGLRLNFGTIGSALLWSPMYAVADAGVRVARALGASVEADGFSRPYLAALAYGSAIYGFLAVLLSAFVARRVVGEGQLAAAIVWGGTPLLFYMYLAPGMAHATSAFSVAAFVAAWLVVRERWSIGGVAALGGLAALMTMVREQDAFYAIGPAVDFLWSLSDDVRTRRPGVARRKLIAAGVGIVTLLVCMAPQFYAYIVLNGRIGPDVHIQNKMYWSAPHALRVLLSPQHGLLVWTPLVLLALAGLIRALVFSRRESPGVRRIATCMLAMFAAQVYVSGSIDSWTVAGSFGQRRFVGATVLVVTGIAILLHHANGWRRTALGLVMVGCIWWNLGLMAQFGAGMMDRQRLQLGRNAYNTFVSVPLTLPDLAYRYLFDRSSFYQRGVQFDAPDGSQRAK
jgi:hypothetical protein